MRILFIHERENGDGAVERSSDAFDQHEVLIGRGGASDIVLANAALSLVHAKVYLEDGRVSIADMDSFVGVRVNNTRVARHTLTSGDVIQLGELSLLVGISGDQVTLTLRSVSQECVSDTEVVARRARKLQLESYLPSIRLLSFVAALLVLAGCFAYPLVSGRYREWSSGPVSNAHRVIENDCQRCHLTPFERVEDLECLNCHVMSQHAEGEKDFLSKHKGLELRCAQCHMEHNGDDGVILRDSRQCVSCHATMSGHKGGALDVANLATHPQFRISVVDNAGGTQRVPVDDPKGAIDSTAIKLNHAVHLREGLRGPQGPTTLQCNACHELSTDKREMLPVSFDRNCRSCHSLGFDERLPDKQLPHGDDSDVYPTLFAEYAKLLLLDGGRETAAPIDGARILPGGGDTVAESRPLSPDAMLVQSSARRAEEEVFTRTGCFLCHTYREKPLSDQRVDETRYTITAPNIPAVWMTKARFDHGAHEELSCESCHEKTRTSTETKDLLLPSIAVCRECHMEGAKAGFVESDCTQCHAYHAALEVPREKKQSLTDFLHTLTR